MALDLNFNTMLASRRMILGRTALSAAAVAMLGGQEAMAAGMRKGSKMSSSDVDILNVALGLEHEAIAAYQLGAESGLLTPSVLGVAVAFQSHHKQHRDALIGTIQKMGGKAVMSKSNGDYAAALNAGSLKNQTDVLRLAQKLERGAANAYIGVIPSFGSKELAQISARLAADETMHWTALSSALGDALPTSALSFGA